MYGTLMVDLALPDGEKWPSSAHRRVAELALCLNPKIHNREEFIRCGNILREYSEDGIKRVTPEDLTKKGIPIVTR